MRGEVWGDSEMCGDSGETVAWSTAAAAPWPPAQLESEIRGDSGEIAELSGDPELEGQIGAAPAQSEAPTPCTAAAAAATLPEGFGLTC